MAEIILYRSPTVNSRSRPIPATRATEMSVKKCRCDQCPFLIVSLMTSAVHLMSKRHGRCLSETFDCQAKSSFLVTGRARVPSPSQ